MATRPTANMSLLAFNAKTLKTWMAKRIRFHARVDLKIDKVLKQVNITLAQRVRIAGQFLRDAVVVNLSRPVRKITKYTTVKHVDPSTGQESIERRRRVVVDENSRSVEGEFPRADTTRLMKDVFHQHDASKAESAVGTTLAYGAHLELRMDRSYLRRTANEMRKRLVIIIKGSNAGASS